jgi:NADH-quinone oxidoreductase subunit C
MSPATLTDVAGPAAVISEAFDTTTIDVPVERWVSAATALRDDSATSFGFFDWLSAYDDGAGGVVVVARLWSVAHRAAVILRTTLAPDSELPTLTSVWPGADWHEREAFEMFGIRFDGHPNLVPLLLPDGFDGHPLRKDFVLATRVAKDWPGAKDPGDSAGRPKRRNLRPPGVPLPGSWGPSS